MKQEAMLRRQQEILEQQKALIIQRYTRGLLSRKCLQFKATAMANLKLVLRKLVQKRRMNKLKLTQHSSILKLQSRIRGFFSRMRLSKLSDYLPRLQARLRGYLTRKSQVLKRKKQAIQSEEYKRREKEALEVKGEAIVSVFSSLSFFVVAYILQNK
jgi:hypothetical protein